MFRAVPGICRKGQLFETVASDELPYRQIRQGGSPLAPHFSKAGTIVPGLRDDSRTYRIFLAPGREFGIDYVGRDLTLETVRRWRRSWPRERYYARRVR